MVICYCYLLQFIFGGSFYVSKTPNNVVSNKTFIDIIISSLKTITSVRNVRFNETIIITSESSGWKSVSLDLALRL